MIMPQAVPEQHAARPKFSRRATLLILLLLLYLGLASFQLGLPGLHYDEAKEAGVNAMELLTGQPVTPFRGVAITLGGQTLPLMVQDYIGALNVYLALPFLSLSGIGVPNLRFLSVLLGLLSLITVERAISSWVALQSARREPPLPITWVGLLAVALLAASPSFIFWSRQGIFVTNVMQPLCFGAIWMGIEWLRRGRRRHLIGAAFLGGLTIYAKLLALWLIGPLILLLLSWVWAHRDSSPLRAGNWLTLGLAGLFAFLLPLLPLILFNLQSGGTLTALFSNAGESYYGVDNLNLMHNAPIRLAQLQKVLVGDQFWYLGGPFGNRAAPTIALVSLLVGLWLAPRRMMGWLLMMMGAFCLSLFTISDLFITHYALLQPLLVGGVALGLGALLDKSASAGLGVTPSQKLGRMGSILPFLLVALWLLLDLTATVRYHQALTQTGGLGDHSDATYHLAYHLRYNGLGAPIVLDWGMDAPIRYLSEGTVRPIEIFGYDSPTAPDPAFAARLAQFLDNPSNVYLLHTAGATIFAGRREQFLAAAEERSLSARLVETFAQRNGTPLFELWQVDGQVDAQ